MLTNVQAGVFFRKLDPYFASPEPFLQAFIYALFIVILSSGMQGLRQNVTKS